MVANAAAAEELTPRSRNQFLEISVEQKRCARTGHCATFCSAGCDDDADTAACAVCRLEDMLAVALFSYIGVALRIALKHISGGLSENHAPGCDGMWGGGSGADGLLSSFCHPDLDLLGAFGHGWLLQVSAAGHHRQAAAAGRCSELCGRAELARIGADGPS